MTDDFLSIGEVLNHLEEEFSEITISKIRFLEQQGLISPERTPSGYRKFSSADIDLLRWILTQQRDAYLPLRVIKERIRAGDVDLDIAPIPSQTPGESPEASSVSDFAASKSASTPAAVPSTSAPRRSQPARRVGPPPSPIEELDFAESETREQLAARLDLSVSRIQELVRFGLIAEQRSGGTFWYGPDDAAVAELAAGFLEHGIEPRHLRRVLQAVEGQADLVTQVVGPLMRQRNPEARRRAAEVAGELLGRSEQLYRALLERHTRQFTDGI